MRVREDDGTRIFVFIASLCTWYLIPSGTTSKVPENDLQYLRVARSSLMLVFSQIQFWTTVSGKIHMLFISFNITVVVDVFTEILIYNLRSSLVKRSTPQKLVKTVDRTTYV